MKKSKGKKKKVDTGYEQKRRNTNDRLVYEAGDEEEEEDEEDEREDKDQESAGTTQKSAKESEKKEELPSDITTWARVLAYLRVFYSLYGLEVS